MLYNVIITDGQFSDHSAEKEVLKEIGIISKIKWKTEKELASQIAGADALLVQYAPITKELIESLNQCRVIVRYGIGVDNIDLEAAGKRGIPVCNVPDYCLDEVADHTISMAVSAIRQIGEVDRRVRNGQWLARLPQPVSPFSKLKFCLVGFGRIARGVAKRAKGLGFQVSAYDPYADPSVFLTEGVTRLPLEELIASADVLSLHMPSTRETMHFINEKVLHSLKSSALIVNTSRGSLVDQKALADAVLSGGLAGAALDVFETEPLPVEDKLRDAPNVILSSHIAWYSEESIVKLQQNAAEEIRRVLTGHRPRYVVNGVNN